MKAFLFQGAHCYFLLFSPNEICNFFFKCWFWTLLIVKGLHSFFFDIFCTFSNHFSHHAGLLSYIWPTAQYRCSGGKCMNLREWDKNGFQFWEMNQNKRKRNRTPSRWVTQELCLLFKMHWHWDHSSYIYRSILGYFPICKLYVSLF